ncbi:angiopoietin-related protein 7-like [Physella acuta]|uniref:angiopoietin-related protein 7-like n=1 Tax=Physella acuta TaxID=109671 RepID=UPI0027DD6B12|nr:angiopoietin-related protein 7-like [Physella acuta]
MKMDLLFLFLLSFSGLVFVESVDFDVQRNVFTIDDKIFCARLDCTADIRTDTDIYALIKISILGSVRRQIASVSLSTLFNSDANSLSVLGHAFNNQGKLTVNIRNSSICVPDDVICEVDFINLQGNNATKVTKLNPQSTKSGRSIILMNLKAEVPHFDKTIDSMGYFLKTLKERENSEVSDMTLSLKVSKLDAVGVVSNYSNVAISETSRNGNQFVTSPESVRNVTQFVASNNKLEFEDKLNTATSNFYAKLGELEEKLLKKIEESENKTAGRLEIYNVTSVQMETHAPNLTSGLEQRLNQVMEIFNQSLAAHGAELKETSSSLVLLNSTVYELKREFQNSAKCVKSTDNYLPHRIKVTLDGDKEALCDTITDGGGWILIQRRIKGDVNFTREWSDYKNGFGSLKGDFWLGNDIISKLTSQGYTDLRFDIKYKNKNYYAVYNNFKVQDETLAYKVSFTTYSGNATDNFQSHNGSKFSTPDRDNDRETTEHCAQEFKGGWWYHENCHLVNPNGVWGSRVEGEGVNWSAVTTFRDSAESMEMKLRQA